MVDDLAAGMVCYTLLSFGVADVRPTAPFALPTLGSGIDVMLEEVDAGHEVRRPHQGYW